MLSWTGSHRPRSYLVELFGLITCVRTRLGQVAKLLGARADAFGSGKSRRRRCGRERGAEVTLREQQGWGMKHGDMRHAHCKHLEPCMYAVSVRHAKKMCVRHESVCTSCRVVFYNITTEHDSAFVLLQFGFQLRIFEMCVKVDFLFVSLCFLVHGGFCMNL